MGTQHSPGHLRQTEATLPVASPPFWSFPWVVSAVLGWFSMLEMQKCRKRHTRRVCADQDQRDPSLIPRSTKIRMNHMDHCAGDNKRDQMLAIFNLMVFIEPLHVTCTFPELNIVKGN